MSLKTYWSTIPWIKAAGGAGLIRAMRSSGFSSAWNRSRFSVELAFSIVQRACINDSSCVESITFGKFFKAHPCNMKEFKMYVGITESHMTEVLHSGLKNDPIRETFHIQHINSTGICFPTRYIKIIPLSAHGQNFHISIWHVSMMGITDEAFVQQIQTAYDEYRETAVLRQILKHLRQRRLLTPYQTILSRSSLQLEHPLVTQLHESVVLQGDWTKAEQLVHTISEVGLLDAYLHACQPHAVWKRLRGTDADGDVPSPRGGHAMCIDPVNDMIYLFGGWDGQKSLDDFWVYNIRDDKWRVLSHSTSQQHNAPGARSCHKMVFDTKTGSIYILGRLSDTDSLQPTSEPSRPAQTSSADSSSPSTRSFCAEFYRYHTRGADSGNWDFLAFDTGSSGGPPLIFDHQMVMDCDAQIVYVFGGRVVDGDWDSVKYSGLYSYNVRLSKWKLLQHPDNISASQVVIPSRFGHSMVLEPKTRTLFIFAGQRDEKYLSDMYAYDIATNTATELYTNFTSSGGPDACFAQRAVINPSSHEIYVFCGLTRRPQAGSTAGSAADLLSNSPNWAYRYDPCPGKWIQILPEPENAQNQGREDEEPLPRYVHQVVYNPNTELVYMHGGSAGVVEGGNSGDGDQGELQSGDRDAVMKERRLDDFWQMSLKRPAREEIVRRAIYQIRRQQFREMCEEVAPVKALNFLQAEVSSVVDHNDPEETEVFRSLLTHLLAPAPTTFTPTSPVPSLDADTVDSSPPRKRSRPNTPEEKWTDHLDDDDITPGTPKQAAMNADRAAQSVSAHALRAVEDPLERRVDSSSAESLSAARFTQRNEVFENLLEFISENDKQASGSLLDLVDVDEGGL